MLACIGTLGACLGPGLRRVTDGGRRGVHGAAELGKAQCIAPYSLAIFS